MQPAVACGAIQIGVHQYRPSYAARHLSAAQGVAERPIDLRGLVDGPIASLRR